MTAAYPVTEGRGDGMTNYVTITEADAIISTLIPSSDPDRAAWDAINDPDKTAYLTRAMLKIERLPYTGRKAVLDQETQFPRYGQAAVPEAVKQALAVEACALVTVSGEAQQRNRIKAQGIKSFTAGSLSESYDRVSGPAELFSDLARYLLLPYLSGVVDCV